MIELLIKLRKYKKWQNLPDISFLEFRACCGA